MGRIAKNKQEKRGKNEKYMTLPEFLSRRDDTEGKGIAKIIGNKKKQKETPKVSQVKSTNQNFINCQEKQGRDMLKVTVSEKMLHVTESEEKVTVGKT